jgi:hypothetical protein
MAHYYRLYSLDEAGRLDLPEEIAAANDQEAISKVRELKPNALQCEIWKGGQLITSLRRQDFAS